MADPTAGSLRNMGRDFVKGILCNHYFFSLFFSVVELIPLDCREVICVGFVKLLFFCNADEIDVKVISRM